MWKVEFVHQLRLGSYPGDNTTTGHVTILEAQALKSEDNWCILLRLKYLPAVIPSSHISVSGSINALILSLTNTYSRDDFLKAGRLTFLLSFTCLAIPFSPPPCLGSGKSWEGCMSQYLLSATLKSKGFQLPFSLWPANLLLLMKLFQRFLRHGKGSWKSRLWSPKRTEGTY